MSSFIVYHEMNFSQLTPDEIVSLQAKIQDLEPMDMKLFTQKLKLIDENYPWSLPSWVVLGSQLISGAFILTKILLMVWFCLKHRKSMTTLSKILFPGAKKIHSNPKVIEQLVQCASDLVTDITVRSNLHTYTPSTPSNTS